MQTDLLRTVTRRLFLDRQAAFWLERLHPTWSPHELRARVVEVITETPDARTFVLRPNRHWAGHRAGQHVNLGIEIDGVRLTRSYSLTAPARADGLLPITVKAIEGGKVSRHLCHDARMGDIVDLGQAFGEMTLPALPRGAFLLLAAGSGITPLMALVRDLAGQGMPADTTLLYWVRRRGEACFVDELRALAAAHPGFRFRLLLTREAAQAADEAEGRIDDALLGAHAGDLSARQVMACGP
ncbi:MAG: ferredoxin reductase, partial [Kofleriaceae bacterium]